MRDWTRSARCYSGASRRRDGRGCHQTPWRLASRRRLQRFRGAVQAIVCQQKVEHRRLRKLWFRRPHRGRHILCRVGQGFDRAPLRANRPASSSRRSRACRRCRPPAQRGLHLIADCLDLTLGSFPILVDQLENGWKAIRVPLIFWREIASGKKGLEVRRQKQIVWPSA